MNFSSTMYIHELRQQIMDSLTSAWEMLTLIIWYVLYFLMGQCKMQTAD